VANFGLVFGTQFIVVLLINFLASWFAVQRYARV
jgi:hypothetical protein